VLYQRGDNEGEELSQDKSRRIVVTGAGGFIGGNLVTAVRSQNHTAIRAVDIKPLREWFQRHDDVENVCLDPRL
jgi:nucleoside-diphosphate-sugar epimerase